MIWSLLKILFFVALVALLTLGAGYVMETGPGVQIKVGTQELNLGPLQAIIGALLIVAIVWLVLKLAGLLVATVRFLNGDETALSRYFDRNRERKGYAALTEGLMAIASGEGREAMAKAAKAEKYLKRPELTNLITAQAAEMSGDRKKAEETYKQLLGDDRTRFVGIRGILKQKLVEGDTDTALKLAEKAFALKPRNEEVQDTLLQLQAGAADWSGARTTLGAKLRHGSMPRDLHRRRDAVLALSQARDSDDAAAAAIEANRLSPGLVPAAVLAAKAHLSQNKPRYATKAITTAWAQNPHPELAAAFAAIEPNESPQDRIKRFVALTKVQPDHPETMLLKAELNLAAEDFPEARRSIGKLYETDPTVRSLTIMAAIERGEGSDDTVVRAWLTKAISAARDPAWICDNCGHIHGEWSATCNSCASFDTLSWKRPPEADMSNSSTAQMLPLIVGKPTAPSTDLGVAQEVIDADVEDAIRK